MARNTQTVDRAVTPVIGIILLVAITVILAAVIGTFAIGLQDRETNPAPAVSFDYDYDESSNELTITHNAGDGFDRAKIEFVRADGGSPTVADSWPAKVKAGDQTTLSGVDSDDTIRIVWEDPRDEDTTAVLDTWEGPDS